MNDTSIDTLEARGVTKHYGTVVALQDVSVIARSGEVLCILGDNGAGKSTLIRILSGVIQPDAGSVFAADRPLKFDSPRSARQLGIATVYQDLAVMPLMSVSRNFFLGREPSKGWGPFRRLDQDFADRVTREELKAIGIDLRSTAQLAGTLSGGERQSLAVARASYFGARFIILDEPTSALGVKEAAVVLRNIMLHRAAGVGIILITHNVYHALPVGDRFSILDRGHCIGTYSKNELDVGRLEYLMGGGDDLAKLTAELQALGANAT
ncbi:MAG: ATP-binding cassette domain-containing protein [Candidatus Limnocylindrales bacterium]